MLVLGAQAVLGRKQQQQQQQQQQADNTAGPEAFREHGSTTPAFTMAGSCMLCETGC